MMNVIQALTLTLWAFRFFVGACFFSFLNVVIYRLPRGESIARGRSHCVECGHELSAGELIPLVSYLAQGAKCRACGSKISVRYPLVEAAGGFLFVLCGNIYGTGRLGLLSARGGLVFAFLGILTAAAWIDAETRIIPNVFPVATLALGFLSLWAFPGTGLAERLAGALIISVPMLLLALAVPGAFGGGDIKLMAASGFLLGARANVAAMFFALLMGGAYSGVMLAAKKVGRRQQIAFGPFLAAGLALAAFIGKQTADWYLGLL